MISIRFDFSQFNEVLVPLHGCLQYVLPANLAPLVSALTSSNLKNDSRLTAPHSTLQRMTDAIEAHRARIVGEPNWFAATHHRRRVNARESSAGLAPLTLLPSMSTLPTLSVGDDEEEEYVEGPTTDKQPLLIQMDQQSTSDVYTEEAQTQAHVEIDMEQTTAVIDEVESGKPAIHVEQGEVNSEQIEEQETNSIDRSPVEVNTKQTDFSQQIAVTKLPEQQIDLQKAPVQIQQVQQHVNTRLPDPMDSGVFDDSSGMFTTSDVTERLHDKSHQEVVPEQVCAERIEAEKAAANKWRPDENMDSGLISDADLHMISAT